MDPVATCVSISVAMQAAGVKREEDHEGPQEKDQTSFVSPPSSDTSIGNKNLKETIRKRRWRLGKGGP